MTKILQHPNINPNIKSKPKPKLQSGLQPVFRPPVSFHPKDMVKELDLAIELTDNKDLYVAGDSVKPTSLYNFPNYIFGFVRRAKLVLEEDNRIKVGSNTILSCLVSNGLDDLEKDIAIRNLRDKGKSFRRLQIGRSVDRDTHNNLQQILDWFGAFPLAPPDLSSAGIRRKQSIRLPEEISLRVADLAEGLGTNVSSIICFSCLISLSALEDITSYDSEDINRYVKVLYKNIEIRDNLFETLLSSLNNVNHGLIR